MARNKWVSTPATEEKLNKAERLSEKLSIDSVTGLLLIDRGLDTEEKLDRFFESTDIYPDPFLLPNMDRAVKCINEVIERKGSICIYGDYDVDGVSSVSILYLYFKSRGVDVSVFFPNRLIHGYGLSRETVDIVKKRNPDLIITVDNGISSIKEAEYIKELGIKLIVTDHHLPGETLPSCEAVVNPHIDEDGESFTDYCGAGVALLLAAALEGDTEKIYGEYSDLAALATVADIVPLQWENRKIVKHGLDLINSGKRLGIKALRESGNRMKGDITSGDIGFCLGPRINAAGRMKDAADSFRLLVSEDPEEAAALAENLESINNLRKDTQEKIIEEAERIILSDPGIAHRPVIVVSGEGWHKGVLGIAASNLLEKYGKPVFVFSNEDGVSVGSARSIKGFSIFDALNFSKDLLIRYGGHTMAGGATLKTEDLPAFIERITEFALESDTVYPETHVDYGFTPDSVTVERLDVLSALEPFGETNPNPLFIIPDSEIDEIKPVGENGKHKQIFIKKHSGMWPLKTIYFNQPELPYRPGDKVDILVELSPNEYAGTLRVNTQIQDIRPAGTDDDLMVKSEILYDRLMAGYPLSASDADFMKPDRSNFADIYVWLKKEISGVPVNIRNYEYIYSKNAGNGNNLCKTRVALKAMRELGLIAVDENGGIDVPHMEKKVDLGDAPVIRLINSYAEGEM